MVVDDEEFCITVMEIMLSRFGIETQHQIDFCINGTEAINVLKDTINNNGVKYKLIMMDFNMPVMDGIEATKIIR